MGNAVYVLDKQGRQWGPGGQTEVSRPEGYKYKTASLNRPGWMLNTPGKVNMMLEERLPSLSGCDGGCGGCRDRVSRDVSTQLTTVFA